MNATKTEIETQIIATSLGAVRFTWPETVTEKTGKDITGDPVWISLGTFDAPGTWQTPDIISHPTVSSVVVQLLVDNTTLPGAYYVWVKVSDSPEIIPDLRGHRVIVD